MNLNVDGLEGLGRRNVLTATPEAWEGSYSYK
jgi:hypothetical protein